jgi:hypothetical protein
MDMSTITTFSLLGIFFALLTWVVFSVTQTARRRKRSPIGLPDNRQLLRTIICTVFIVSAGYFIYSSIHGIQSGVISYVMGGRFTRGILVTVYRVKEPNTFWVVVFIYIYFALLFLYLSIAEIIYAVKRRMRIESEQ